jgi:hypothetical protein
MEISVINEQGKPVESSAMESELTAETLSAKTGKFSILSADIAKILSDLSIEVKRAFDQLQTLQSEVDLKKNELKMLHNLDVSAASLKQLIEDHRVQNENLERLRDSCRASWEEEKARFDREQKEYREAIQIQHQREEDEYRRRRAEEQLGAQQRLEADLEAAKQKCQRMQQALEKDCLEREQIIREKELQCSRLIQELEQFILKLNKRVKPQSDAFSNLYKKTLPDQSKFAGVSESAKNHPELYGESEEERFQTGSYDEDSLMLKNIGSDSAIQDFPAASIFGDVSMDAVNAMHFFNDMPLTKDGKIERSNANLAAKRDSATLKFSLKKFPSSKPEV